MLRLDRNLVLLVKIKLVLTLPSIFTLEVVRLSMFDRSYLGLVPLSRLVVACKGLRSIYLLSGMQPAEAY